ncbi:MAG: transglutaminase family protein, partial [Deltaproteobacteria bacterium]|nr:transglutaminase family protein [Kofleriaceae bacterium]
MAQSERGDPRIWIGAEPTFTRRESSDPAWLWQADPDGDGGDEKQRRAAVLAVELARRVGGGEVRRLVGRQYPEEARARFCFGVRMPETEIGHGH